MENFKPIAMIRCTELFLLIGSTWTTVVQSRGPKDSFQCGTQETVFFHNQCYTCLSQLTPKVKNNKNEVRANFSSIGELAELTVVFSTCPKSVSDFTAARIRSGAVALNGRRLDVVTIQRPPFSVVIEDSQGKKSYRGVIFEFLNAMEAKWNFSMRIFTSPDGNWGAQNKIDGSWNGMIGVILRKEADLSAASLSVTIERARVVDFTIAFHQEPTAILIPAPTEGEKLTALIRPLSPAVWLGLGLCIAVIVPTFYAVHVLSLSIHSEDKEQRLAEKKVAGTLTRLGLYIIGSLVQESNVSPLEKSTRLLVAIWWMVTLVLANTYLAFLVSFLAAPKLHNVVDSIEELAGQSQLHWTFRFGSAHYALFKSDTSVGVFKEIGDGVKDEDLAKTDLEGVSQVLTGHWAFIKEKSFLDVALGNDFEAHKKCRITLAKHEFYTVGVGLAAEKNSIYLPLWDYEISNSIASGLMDKWKQIHWPKNSHCIDAGRYIISTQPKNRKLALPDVSGAFFILGTGIIISSFAFLLERFLHSAVGRAKKVHASLQREKPKPTPWIFLK